MLSDVNTTEAYMTDTLGIPTTEVQALLHSSIHVKEVGGEPCVAFNFSVSVQTSLSCLVSVSGWTCLCLYVCVYMSFFVFLFSLCLTCLSLSLYVCVYMSFFVFLFSLLLDLPFSVSICLCVSVFVLSS